MCYNRISVYYNAGKEAMKFVVLVDSGEKIKRMLKLAESKNPFFIDTQNRINVHEYKYLLDHIHTFLKKDDEEIMLAKYSGNEEVADNLADESSAMIVSLSCNKKSKHYVEHPVDIFSELLTIF
jgi:hypothetical protein